MEQFLKSDYIRIPIEDINLYGKDIKVLKDTIQNMLKDDYIVEIEIKEILTLSNNKATRYYLIIKKTK